MERKRHRATVLRRIPLTRPVLGLVLVLLLVWSVASGVGIHRDLRRLDQVGRLTHILGDLRGRIHEVHREGSLARKGQVSSGLMARLQDDRDLRALEAEARVLLEGDTLALRALGQAMRETRETLAQSHEALLLAVEARLARERSSEVRARDRESASEAAWDEAEAHLVAAWGAIEQMGAHPQASIDRMAAGRHKADLLFSSAILLSGLLLWLSWHSLRQQNRYLKSARLVEEMLEAYSRRLESMNAELEQVSLLKTQFLANTSHELLTPLNGIMGSLELLRDGHCGDPAEQREFLDQAYHSAERLLDLIHDLLDLCRLEEGNLALRSRGVDAGPLIERAITAHRAAIDSRGLALLVVGPAEGWPRVQVDAERLNRVLQHLLSNAVKFTEAGSVRVTGRVEREGAAPRLRLEIADTGVGIEPEKLSQVFELFRQGDGSNTRRFGGTGLGLTLCRHLIHGMGGRIGMESDGPGRGARAWFTVPLAGAAGRSAAGGLEPSEDPGREQPRAADPTEPEPGRDRHAA